MALTDSEGETLVRLARYAVSNYLERGVTINPPGPLVKLFRRKGRVFVTILSNIQRAPGSPHELRGCIGYLEARLHLVRATINAAINAATADPRFPPMKSSELEYVIFELNMLSAMQKLQGQTPMGYPEMIEIGVDGLFISQGGYRGLLLPGVAVEWGWNAEEFLMQCSLKAGLHPDAWMNADTRVEKFQSEIFRELKPLGPVIRVDLRSEPAPGA